MDKPVKKAKEAKLKKSFRTNHPQKYEYAFMLYLQQIPQKEICERVGVTEKTVSEWKQKGQWDIKRTSKMMSTEDTFNRLLLRINELINQEKFSPDELSKLVSSMKAFKKDTTIDDTINVFMKYQNWLIQNKHLYPDMVNEAFLKNLAYLQNEFVKYIMGNKYQQ